MRATSGPTSGTSSSTSSRSSAGEGRRACGTGPFADMDDGHRRRACWRSSTPPRRGRAGRVLRRRRPQPAGLRPGDRHRAGCPASFKQAHGLHGRRVLAARPARAARRHLRSPRLAGLGVRRAGPRRQPGRADVLARARRSPRILGRGGHRGAEARRPPSPSRSSGAPPWCSPSRTPARTSAPAARKADQQADGSWHIEGVKRFITSRRARPAREHRPLRAAPGPRAPARAPRACRCSSCRSSSSTPRPASWASATASSSPTSSTRWASRSPTTCEVTFGDRHARHGLAARRGARRHPADVPHHRVRAHDGGHQGDRHAVDGLPQRARTTPRTASRAPTWRRRPTRPRRAVTIIHHPDVRRMLMLQKSYAEGMRALVLYTATSAGRGRAGARPPATRRRPPTRGQRPAAAAGEGLRLGDGRTSCSAPSRCRRSAARATCRTTRSSSTSATRRSTPCTRAPRPSRASTSSSARSSGTGRRLPNSLAEDIKKFLALATGGEELSGRP